MQGLRELLRRNVLITAAGRDGFFEVAGSFFTPGFWTAYIARARQRGLHNQELGLPADRTGYARAIGIERALGDPDSYPYERVHAGQNYSPLVLLDTPELAERAIGEINGCIRRLFPEDEYSKFVASICELVGDLLDNVWSHGKSSGFSMTQRWGGDRDGFFFEFAIADCGLGVVVESDNHHLGLGLAKLVAATERFKGRLWLASGDALLNIHPHRGRTYENIDIEWQGVAAACRFHSSQVRLAVQAESETEFQRMFATLVRNSG